MLLVHRPFACLHLRLLSGCCCSLCSLLSCLLPVILLLEFPYKLYQPACSICACSSSVLHERKRRLLLEQVLKLLSPVGCI